MVIHLYSLTCLREATDLSEQHLRWNLRTKLSEWFSGETRREHNQHAFMCQGAVQKAWTQ